METIVGTGRFGHAFHNSVWVDIAFVSSIDLNMKALEILGHIVQVRIKQALSGFGDTCSTLQNQKGQLDKRMPQH
jgi:hypothetical protein